MNKTYRRKQKPLPIQAVQYNGTNEDDVYALRLVTTLGGLKREHIGTWWIRNEYGDLLIRSAEQFEKEFEEIPEERASDVLTDPRPTPFLLEFEESIKEWETDDDT